MKRFAAVFAAALMLGGALPIVAQPSRADLVPLPPGADTELPRAARPWHYAIAVTPDAAALTFAGHETIDLTLFEPAREVVLNAVHLTIAQASLMPEAGGAAIPLTVTFDEARGQARFAAPAPLAAGRYRLSLAYSGSLNRQTSGFFALDYPDKRTGKTTRGLFTQFEVPDARQFAPIFDEPALKATFDLSAVVPASQLAVSNMPALREEPLGNGTKRVTFATTPRMASYLLFFAVGDFERITKRTSEGTEVGIVSPAGSGETARYTLDALAQLLPYYNSYFGTRFPLPKLDNVAAPGSSQTFGAMENWGSILTFERGLLVDPRNTSPQMQRYAFVAQAHETAHQWFGDLVTMAWWDDLWLNEGFASWFETKATDHFHPEWSMLVGRVGAREGAMRADSLSSSHPVVIHVRTAPEANSAFDSISYSKGAAIISMLEAYEGEDRWRDGVRRYLAAHAYGNAVTAELWQAQEAVGARDIARIADSFTRQAGVPLVNVRQACAGGSTRVSLAQGEFSRDRMAESAAHPRHWLVPLTIRASDGSLHKLLLDGSATVTVPGCGPTIVNGGQLGYFRTLYAPGEVGRFAAALANLPPIDQIGLVQDNLALARAGYQAYAPALDLLAAVPPGANAVVARSAVADWGEFSPLAEQPSERARLAGVVHRLWGPRLAEVGFDPKPGESGADAELRSQLLTTLGSVGDPAVVAEARRRFARLAQDRHALDGPLKSTWLAIIARHATPADWDLIRQTGRAAPTSVERDLYYGALGDAIDDTLAQRALDLALTEEPGTTSRAGIVRAVARHHSDLAFAFALANEPQINAMLDGYSQEGFIPGLAASSDDPAMVGRLEALRAKRPETQRKTVDEQLASLRQRLAAAPRIRAQFGAWLAAQPA